MGAANPEVWPPSTGRTAPVRDDGASSNSQTATAAVSAGLVIRAIDSSRSNSRDGVSADAASRSRDDDADQRQPCDGVPDNSSEPPSITSVLPVIHLESLDAR